MLALRTQHVPRIVIDPNLISDYLLLHSYLLAPTSAKQHNNLHNYPIKYGDREDLGTQPL